MGPWNLVRSKAWSSWSASVRAAALPAFPSVHERVVTGASPVLQGQERTTASPLPCCPVTLLFPPCRIPGSAPEPHNRLLCTPFSSAPPLGNSPESSSPVAVLGLPRAASASPATLACASWACRVGPPFLPSPPPLGYPVSFLPTDPQGGDLPIGFLRPLGPHTALSCADW